MNHTELRLPPQPQASLLSTEAKQYVLYMEQQWAEQLSRSPSPPPPTQSGEDEELPTSGVLQLHAHAQRTFPASISEKALQMGERFSTMYREELLKGTSSLHGVASRSLYPSIPEIPFTSPAVARVAAGRKLPRNERRLDIQLRNNMIARDTNGRAATLFSEILVARHTVDIAMRKYVSKK